MRRKADAPQLTALTVNWWKLGENCLRPFDLTLITGRPTPFFETQASLACLSRTSLVLKQPCTVNRMSVLEAAFDGSASIFGCAATFYPLPFSSMDDSTPATKADIKELCISVERNAASITVLHALVERTDRNVDRLSKSVEEFAKSVQQRFDQVDRSFRKVHHDIDMVVDLIGNIEDRFKNRTTRLGRHVGLSV